MDYKMDGRQVNVCGGNLVITSGRLDQMRMETHAQDEKRVPEGQRKMDFIFTTPKRKNSKTEPYVPPHRRIQANGDQNVVDSRQRIPKPALPPGYCSNTERRSSSDYDYQYSEYPSFAYINRNTYDRKSVEAYPRKSPKTINNFLDLKKNFHLPNGTNGNQVEDNTDDSEQIAQRVLKLVDTHVNTGLKEILDGLYEQTYGESLPPDLLNRWKFSVTLKKDSRNLVLNRKFADSSDQIEVPTTRTVPAFLELDRLEKEFWVIIHKCKSVSELWGIIMDKDHRGEVEKLSDEMQSFYEQLKAPDNPVVSGSYYALFDGSWHRVQCLQSNDTAATVLFIDRGDEDIKPVNQLHVLNSQFCSLPAQAIKMSLAGLEIFADLDELQPVLIHSLIDKSIYARVEAVTQDHLVVQLYSSENDDDGEVTSVNELIVDKILEMLDPRLYIEYDKLVPANVSSIKNGIYVQLDIPSYKYIGLLMEKAATECNSNKNLQRQVVVRHEKNTVYFVKSNEDNIWYRGKIIKFLSEHEIQVFLIDVGSIATTNRENVIYLEKVCSILTKYPAQAIQVQLNQIPHLNSKMQSRLQNIISRRKNLFVKFVSVGGNNNLPTVQLKRETDSGFHVSINDALLLSLEEENPNTQDDKVVLEQPSLSVDGSIKSTKSSQNSIIGPRLSIEKSSSKTYSTSPVKSSKSYQHSVVESGLSPDKFGYEDFDTSSIKSLKSIQNSITGAQPRLPIDQYSETSSLLSTKSHQNNKSSNTDFENLSTEKSINKESGNTSSVKATKSSQNVALSSFEKFFNTEFESLSLRPAKSPMKSNTQRTGNYITMYLSSVLTAPKLPEDDYFDVHVILASDPSHFVLQLLQTKTLKFNKMVFKMSETCRSYKGPTLTCESIKVGQLYACKSSDSNDRDWCRAYVTEIKDEKVASVYCCDYGSYKTVDIKNLVPLDNQYYRLPYQAIWAELHGVKPTSKEWTVRSCLRFQELTQSRNFVCRVISKRDTKSVAFQKPTKIPVTVEVIYSVELIDTSSCEEDLDVAHLLIEGGVADKN